GVPVQLGAALATSLRASGLGEPPPETFRFHVPGASANDAAKVPSGPAVARASTRLPAGGVRTVTVRPSPSVAEKFGADGVASRASTVTWLPAAAVPVRCTVPVRLAPFRGLVTANTPAFGVGVAPTSTMIVR